MRSMTIEQLRAASDAGGVAGVTLKGQGGVFLVQVATRSGAVAVLERKKLPATGVAPMRCARRTKPPPIPIGWPPRFKPLSMTPGQASRTMKSWRGRTLKLPT